ncbi:MAG: RdgB/HAM1 family non-canonical purine NTP pyrophosphatase [Bacteroidetes bacterium]|nr:RdgB/HAM1 family non-canonical purine NTP pyrophosphatase [Bacteroidota bacterium]
MKKLLLASNNPDKATEVRELLADLSIELTTLNDHPSYPPTVEDAETLEGNALKKAMEAYQRTGIPSIGDDTGLEVHYLNDQPGVFSSRFAGPNASYADNCAKLLRLLRGVPPRRRAAQFRCVIAFVQDEHTHHCSEGICRGVILESRRGDGGFGYDPVFLPDGHAMTFAEMDLKLKNTLSHRARAIMALKEHLRSQGW